jgi:anaerobic selenocysteine-containing dehydrogenase
MRKPRKKRRIRDGDLVRAFNLPGENDWQARVDGNVQPGVVSARLHWAKLRREDVNINRLSRKTYGPGQLRPVLFRLG